MTTMLLVLSGLCLVSVLAWRAGAVVAAPVGAAAAVTASFFTAPSGPLVLPVALATGVVAAIGLATALGLLHPPVSQHPSAPQHR